MKTSQHIAIIGAGHLGRAIAEGLVHADYVRAEDITLTRRSIHLLEDMAQKGYVIRQQNGLAVQESEIVILTVDPRHLESLLQEIKPILLPEKHLLISAVTGVTLAQLTKWLDPSLAIVRAMPNTAVAIRESMTCLAAKLRDPQRLEVARALFDCLGTTVVIEEELMSAATALGACGIAFFLRMIRAASQGGIEIGFHAEEALAIAAQTAKGAASLLLQRGTHPEAEIDSVTTPRGCTIAGLNRMEHEGLSSAIIQGITESAEKASQLFTVTTE